MPSNDPRPTKAQRQADARAKAAALRRQQESAAKRNRVLAVGGAVLAALVLVGAVAFVFVQNSQNRARYDSVVYGGTDGSVVPPAFADVPAPSVADDGGGIPVSDEGVGVAGAGDTVLSVYFDLQCPACQSFDAVNAADLRDLARTPGITVVYQPLTFLDRYSQGTYYSTRAGNALMVVADQDPEHFEAFITALYENQPAENTSGIPDSTIADIAREVGVPQEVVDRFTAVVSGTYQSASEDGTTTEETGAWRTFSPFLLAATAHGDQVLGGLATPTLLLDGEKLEGETVAWNQPGVLAAYVRQAAGA